MEKKGSTETGEGPSRRGKADFRRGWSKKSLVGDIQEKTMMVEKSAPRMGRDIRAN